MKAKQLFFALLTFFSFCVLSAQVGVGNTDPQASLDISASNTTTPANNDGILIPRMSNFPAAPGSIRDGMLIFYTGTGSSGKGFYYWNDGVGWTPIKATDIDWYEEGTTNAPNDINDNIYTQGNVGIGQNTPVSPLHIGISTPFNLDHANIGQDGIFIVGLGDNSGVNAIGGSISFGPPSSTRGNQRKSAISSVQTSGDVDHTGLAFYVHGNAINQSPMAEGMRLTHNRHLGINNTDPSANLDVIGTIQYEDGNEAAGYVLASDATGNATWIDPNTLITGVERINDLIDGKSDNDGSEDGSSLFLGLDSGAADDSDNNRNVGIGYQSLQDNTTGKNNTALGYRALNNNVDGSQNTAVGLSSLINNNTGSNNTAIGYGALIDNQDGFDNTAVGFGALGNNMSSAYNTSMGVQSLAGNTGASNTALGYRALYTNGTGTRNVAIGLQSLNFNLTGNDNVALGYRSGYSSTGSGNIFLGSEAGNGTTGDNKFFVENTNADEDNALLYGEFGADATTTGNILRTNGELQVGNPTGTGYALPTNQGTANQVLTSNGDGTTQWANVMSNPQYPDGFVGLSPILISGSTLTYTIPAGKNLYITNIFSNNTNYTVSIDAKLIQSKLSNVTLYTSITNPIIVASGEVLTRSNAGTSINGFLVDTVVEPLTQNITTTTSYTVPTGKILILLSGHNATATGSTAIRVTADGATLFDGFSNTSVTSNETTSFHQPMFFPAGTILTSVSSGFDYNINGYLIDN